MAEFKDLSNYVYGEPPFPMKNIGWLGKDLGIQGLSRAVPDGVVERLKEEVRKTRSLSLGLHECEFCVGVDAAVGNGEIHVFSRSGEVYSAPTLVMHYVECHGYVPPIEFCEALNGFPEGLAWDLRAETLRLMLRDPDADPGWRVNSLLDLTVWNDPRAKEAIEDVVAGDQELRLTAPYEVAISLAAIWMRDGEISLGVYEAVDRDIRDCVVAEYSRQGVKFPRGF
ncbi:DUF7919 family protein [Wenjunlia vitaminophila]|uniref:DUF7919 family protein n=1 Tax=Wenjunlia vitaminophila TaxID=76728 RepID=UPI0012FF391F|nr:hypothetical protein [Wenjunlia vitaminophila]